MFLEVMAAVSRWAVPVVITLILAYGFWKGVRVYETFIEGAQEGFWIAVKIIPYMVAIFVALGIFRQSGAMDLMISALAPILGLAGIPPEVLPLAIIRPLSGGGALGVTSELIRTYGPDSFIGRLASTIQGSTETTFFILTFYFGSVGIRRSRHALAVGLLADVSGFLAAVLAVNAVFGGG